MATIHTLRTQYSSLLRVDYSTIPAADVVVLNDLATRVDAGTITMAAATQAVIGKAINTTTVANLSYNFFTGVTPRASGLDYLVSPTGQNPNNLSSAYYQSFNMENRFINFAVNLGKVGEGASSFQTNYGSLSLADAMTKAYTAIFGFAPQAGTANELLSAQVSNGLGGTFTRADYFAEIGRDGAMGQGTKAAMVGWLMAEAAKANLGVYVTANNAFLADLANDGMANFNIDLVGVYGQQPVYANGATITLASGQSATEAATDPALRTTGINDIVTGSAGLAPTGSVSTGDGHDSLTLTGTVSGLIDTGAGNDTVTLANFSKVEVLGATNSGVLRTGVGNDSITIGGELGANTMVDGGLGLDSLTARYIHPTATLSGVEQIFLTGAPAFGLPPTSHNWVRDTTSLDLSKTTGVTEVWNTSKSYSVLTLTNVSNDLVVGMRDTAGSIAINYLAGQVDARVHLDNVSDLKALGSFYSNDLLVRNLTGTLRVSVESDSAFGSLSHNDGKSIILTGEGALKVDRVSIGTAVAGFPPFDVAPAVTHRFDVSGLAKITVGSFSPGAMDNQIILSSGADSLGLYLYGQVRTNLTLGGGADTVSITTAAPPSQSGTVAAFANMRVTNQMVDTFATITDFQKGVDHLDLGAKITTVSVILQSSVGAATTLEQALINVSNQVTTGSVGVFEFGGDSYVYRQDSTIGVNTGDGLIKLVGVTGLSVVTGSATGDIHYG